MAKVLLRSLDYFKAFEAEPYAAARKHAAADKAVAGLMCSYAPQELFHAAGYLPVRILGRAGGADKADQVLQTYACSFARSTLDSALSGELDFLSLAVFSHTCDTMQNLGDLWETKCPQMKTLIVSTPNAVGSKAAENYFQQELRRVRQAIEMEMGPIEEERLQESIALYARHRSAMKQLYDFQREHPEILGGTDMMAVALASFLAPREEHLKHVEFLLAELPEAPPAAADHQPRLLVTGSVCQNSDFLGILEAAGCHVVEDDLCMGARSFCMESSPQGDPMQALGELYLQRRPCAAFHSPDFNPAAHIEARARACRADGVLFLLTKFCDPWGFEYPPMKERLEAVAIPTLMVELEQHAPAPEQYKTRAEAFSELLHARINA